MIGPSLIKIFHVTSSVFVFLYNDKNRRAQGMAQEEGIGMSDPLRVNDKRSTGGGGAAQTMLF